MSEKLATLAKTVDFGAPASFGAHRFRVEIPSGRGGDVSIVEEYGYEGGQRGTPEEELRAVLHTVTATARRLDTVVAVGGATRCSDDGNDTVLAPLLAGIEIPFERAKTNMGLGRTTNVA